MSAAVKFLAYSTWFNALRPLKDNRIHIAKRSKRAVRPCAQLGLGRKPVGPVAHIAILSEDKEPAGWRQSFARQSGRALFRLGRRLERKQVGLAVKSRDYEGESTISV